MSGGKGEDEQGSGEQDDGFDEQSMEGIEINFFPHEAVKAEGGGQRESDPGKSQAAEREIQDGNSDDDDSNPLPAAKAFAQKDHSEKNGEKRVDEITKTGLQNLPAADGVDKHEPIDG